MFPTESNLLWIVFSPIAILTDLAAVFVVLHYRPRFHGTDVCLLSLLTCMLLNALLLLPIPSILGLADQQWSSALCQFYAWWLFTLKIVQIISLVSMCVYCSLILKLPTDRKFFSSVKKLKIWIVLSWVGSAVIGMLPAIGATGPPGEEFYTDNKCAFLPYDIQIGFSIFFLVFNSTGIVVAVISFLDALFLLKSMKRIAIVKYRITRFHPPSASAAMNHNEDSVGGRTRHELYNDLNFSWDMCRFVVVVSSVSFALTHIPFVLIQFSQIIVQSHNREILETIVLWIILLDALLIPHVLWACSNRYRHALVYQFKYYILRDKSVLEEDPSSCVLQAVTQRFIDAKGKQITITSRLKTSRNGSPSIVQPQPNGLLRSPQHIATPSRPPDTGIAVIHASNGDIRRKGQHVGNSPYREDNASSYPSDDIVQRYSANGFETPPPAPRRQSQADSQKSLSPTRSTSSSKDGTELKRSSQRSSARNEWKDKMRKKHLPAIFVNEAFDGEDSQNKQQEIPSSINLKNKYVIRNKEDGQKSMYFYMSSDYHPDYLTDSLPRGSAAKQPSSDADSDGVCNSYDDQDIETILNDDTKDSKVPNGDSEIVAEQQINAQQVNPTRSEHLVEYVTSIPVTGSEQYRNGGSTANEFSDGDEHVQNEPYEVPEVIHVYYDDVSPPTDVVIVNTETQYGIHTDGDDREAKQFTCDKSNDQVESFLDNYGGRYDRESVDGGSESHSTLDDNAETIFAKEGYSTVRGIPDIKYHPVYDNGDVEIADNSFSDYKDVSENSEETDKVTDLDQVRPSLLEGAEDTSDNDTLKDSYTSVSYRALSDSVGSDGSIPHHNYPPNYDIDQGFEEAIEMGYAMANGGGVSLYFDSFDDESTDSVFTNKEFDNLKPEEEMFKTQAVISSRPSSRNSLAGSPSDISNTGQVNVGRPVNSVVDGDAIHIDIQEVNKNSFSNKNFNPWTTSADDTSPRTPDSVGQSPWLDTSGSVADSEMSFESDFSEEIRTINQSNKNHKTNRLHPNVDVYPAYF